MLLHQYSTTADPAGQPGRMVYDRAAALCLGRVPARPGRPLLAQEDLLDVIKTWLDQNLWVWTSN